MSKYVVLYNSKSDNNNGENNAKALSEILKDDELEFVDLVKVEDITTELKKAGDSKVIVCGGDGTLNNFVNHVDEKDFPADLYYFPAGTGNDFWRDISERHPGEKFIRVNDYLSNLPVCTINGKDYKFFNGIGYGIDGYCCEVADKIREKSDGAINYTAIAIKGLLFFFHPSAAKVTVDGKGYNFKKVWMAPVMKGKYYGGGMIPCPPQDRDIKGQLCVLVWHDSGKLGTLMNFPNIFKGEHIKKAKKCKVYTGKEFKVEFAKPCAAQVDGETVLNVSSIVVKA